MLCLTRQSEIARVARKKLFPHQKSFIPSIVLGAGPCRDVFQTYDGIVGCCEGLELEDGRKYGGTPTEICSLPVATSGVDGGRGIG